MDLFHQVKCQRCDAVYSSKHRRCPKCGAKRGDSKAAPVQSSGAELVAGVIVLLVIVVATVILLTSSLKNAQPGKTEKPVKSAAPSSDISSVTASPSPSEMPTASVSPLVEPSIQPTVPPSIAPSITDIGLNRKDFTLSKIGETFQMTATLYPVGSDATIIWISEDESVATVSENGLVTAVDRGNTIVSATAGGFTKECIVRVSADAPKNQSSDSQTSSGSGSVRLSHSDVTLRVSNENSRSFTLKVSGTANGSTVTFASGNDGIATVNSNGLVTAVSKGDTVVTATVKDGDGTTYSLKCIVRVVG